VRIWPAGSLPELQHVAHTKFLRYRSRGPLGTPLGPRSCLDNSEKAPPAGRAKFQPYAANEEQTHFNENRNQIAGALLEDDATVRLSRRQVAALAQQGHEILVVTAAAASSPPR